MAIIAAPARDHMPALVSAAAKPVPPASNDVPLKGMLMMVIAVLLFATMDALVKTAAETYPTGQIIFFRNFVAFLPLSIFVARAGGLGVLRTRHLGGHLIRAGVGLAAMVCFFLSYKLLPLGEAVAIGMAGPLFITALSVPFLGELVGLRRWSAVILGFVGVLVMTRPGSGIFDPAALIPLAGAFFLGLAMVMVRKLSRTENSATIVFYFTITATLVSGMSLPWQWVTPDLAGIAVLVAIGLIGGFAQFTMTQAFRLAPAALVAPFEYLALVFAVGYGYWLWDEVPDLWLLIGAGIVVAAGIYILHRETVRARDQAARARAERRGADPAAAGG
jgi:drug/metabolite transporter (DMT)-like permease